MIQVPGIEGVFVEILPSVGSCNILRVTVRPGSRIPLHTHECASGMGITKGRARTLGKIGDEYVNAGDYIYKQPGEPHGFTDIGDQGFQFLSFSDNAGILRIGGNWDLKFTA